MEKLLISKLRRDGGTQMRVKLSPDMVEEYKDAMLDGASFPPVEVVHDGENFWLWDGFTRVAGAESGGFKSIDMNVRKGSLHDAIFLAAGANAAHGHRRTNDDKRNTVSTLLQMEECAVMSDKQLAKVCGVSRPFVTNMRNGSTRVVRSHVTPSADAITTPSNGAIISGGYPLAALKKDSLSEDENPSAFEPCDDPAETGPTTITTRGAKPIGNLHKIIAERDRLLDQVDELTHLLTGLNDRVVAYELRFETGDPHRELITALNEQKQRTRDLEERIRGLMTEKNEAIRAAKYWKKKAGGK